MTDANQTQLIQLGMSVVILAGTIFTYFKTQRAEAAAIEAAKTGVENKEELAAVRVQINGHTEAVVKSAEQLAGLKATIEAEKIATGDARVALAESEIKIIEAKEVGKAEGRSEGKIS